MKFPGNPIEIPRENPYFLDEILIFPLGLRHRQVFRCKSNFHCPGGLPEQCSGGLLGVPCGECPQGAPAREPGGKRRMWQNL